MNKLEQARRREWKVSAAEFELSGGPEKLRKVLQRAARAEEEYWPYYENVNTEMRRGKLQLLLNEDPVCNELCVGAVVIPLPDKGDMAVSFVLSDSLSLLLGFRLRDVHVPEREK